MPPIESIRSYLVDLGFKIDEPSQRKFKDALKLTETNVAKSAVVMADSFLAVGGAFAAVATGVAAGTLSMMTSFAKQDLQYQLLARRMFMGAEATRKMQIALDTLGVSLQDVLFGPPELKERYKTLLDDQDRMMKNMGGFVKMEDGLRRVRDVMFEFTRMGPELQNFGIAITESVLDKLTGKPESLEQRLKDFNAWFQENMPDLANQVTNVIVPDLKALGAIAKDIFQPRNVKWALDLTVKMGSKVAWFLDLIANSPDLRRLLLGTAGGAIAGGMAGPVVGALLGIPGGLPGMAAGAAVGGVLGPAIGGMLGGGGAAAYNAFGAHDQASSQTSSSGTDYKAMAAAAARKYGAEFGEKGVAEYLAIIDQETNGAWNPALRNKRTHAIGLAQVMPSNWPAGLDPNDPATQLDVGASIFFANVRRRGGNFVEAGKDYYGRGKTPPGEPTTDQYIQQWQKRVSQFDGGQYQPSSMHTTVNVGGIHIMQPNATPEQINKAVKEGIIQANREQTTRLYARVQATYA